MTIDHNRIREALIPFGGKSAMLISLTLKDADRFMEALDTAVADKDTGKMKLAAHALKSIMKQIGAFEVGDLAERLQIKGDQDKLEECIRLYGDMRPLYDETKSFLNSI